MFDRTAQKQRLALVMQAASGWGAMLYLEPHGDVSFLTPICPELRGVEIVAATDQGYDIWRRDGSQYNEPMPVQTNRTLKQVVKFLKKSARSEADLMANAAQWTEDTLLFYKVPRKVA